MEIVVQIIQVIIAITLLMVWVVRPQMATGYRGGNAKNMKEEFTVYGLPHWFMILIGALKIGLALLLLVGIWEPRVTPLSAGAIAVLMVGAIMMHIRVKDPLKKSLPALTLLVLSGLVVILSL